MAAYAGLASLMNNIDQIMSHPRLSASLDKKQTEALQAKAGDLFEFIKKNNYGGGSNEVEDLERQIASAAHTAEDVIESHIVDQIDAGNSKASLGCSLDLDQIIEDMDALMKTAAEVKEKWRAREEEKQPTHNYEKAMEAEEKQPLTTGETAAAVGLEDDVIQLMDNLTVDQHKRRIISIVGMGGTGKSTLAQNLYTKPLINQHFDIRAWATVSQQYNVKEILSKLLSSIGKPPSDKSSTANDLGLEFHKTLSGRRYLIVLDDIWSVKAWDDVRRFFPDNGNGSGIVLTTRLSDVARDCGSSHIFNMKPLDVNKSWELFCKTAFQQENCPYSELEKVGKEIARLCKGLPLSIVVIGGLLLNSPRSVQLWEKVVENIKKNPDSKEKQESLDVLSLSYNHLPPHLKPCFLYMGIFEEDSKIFAPEIIRLWVAEGFLRPNRDQVLEETAEDYLNDLISRNLVLVDEVRRNGKIKYCRIHDLLRDLCLKVAEQQEFFNVTRGGGIPGAERRVVCAEYLDWVGSPLVRSIIAGKIRREHVAYVKYVKNVKYRLLRVLDQDCNSYPSQLYENVNLRYLSYDHYLSNHEWYHCNQYLWKLPTSVSLLWNLQTLIITSEFGCMSVVAPTEIWKMRQLRHVICIEIYLPHPPPSNGLLMLENLYTLTKAYSFRLSEEVCKIIPNINELSLLYCSTHHGHDDSLFDGLRNLDRLHKLQQLRLCFRSNGWEGIDSEVIDKITLPNSLNELSLSGFEVDWDDLRMIGSLPRLQLLKLENLAKRKEGEWSPVDGQFLQLKFLHIYNCGVTQWNADNSHFPVLEELRLSRLTKLAEIPLSIGEIATLEIICVDKCSESAGISAIRIKEDQLEYQDNDALQVEVRIPHCVVKSFKERVEKEGLAVNNIQLLESR